MTTNPIDEIKRIRHQLGADANFDVSRIFNDLREQRARSSRTYLVADNNAMHRSGEADRSEVDNLSSPPGDR